MKNRPSQVCSSRTERQLPGIVTRDEYTVINLKRRTVSLAGKEIVAPDVTIVPIISFTKNLKELHCLKICDVFIYSAWLDNRLKN